MSFHVREQRRPDCKAARVDQRRGEVPAENAVSVVCQLIDVRMDCVDLLKDRTAHHANAVVAVRCETHARTFSAAKDTCDAVGNDAAFVIQPIQRTDNTSFAKIAKRIRVSRTSGAFG